MLQRIITFVTANPLCFERSFMIGHTAAVSDGLSLLVRQIILKSDNLTATRTSKAATAPQVAFRTISSIGILSPVFPAAGVPETFSGPLHRIH